MESSIYFKPYGEELILYIPAAEHGLSGTNIQVDVLRRMPNYTLRPEWFLSWYDVDAATRDVEVHFLCTYPTGRRGLVRLTLREHG
jgi:hypothetical protein